MRRFQKPFGQIMARWIGLLGVAGAVLAGGGSVSAAPELAPHAAVAGVVYRAPVLPMQIRRPFRAPLTRYGPGHRGVDLAAPAGTAVHPAAAGVVLFAGRVAGRGVVVVRHADAIRTEYEPLAVAAHRGEAVTSASVLGVVSGQHGGCADCVHWGARRQDDYFDPLTLLSGLGQVRLVPWTEP